MNDGIVLFGKIGVSLTGMTIFQVDGMYENYNAKGGLRTPAHRRSVERTRIALVVLRTSATPPSSSHIVPFSLGLQIHRVDPETSHIHYWHCQISCATEIVIYRASSQEPRNVHDCGTINLSISGPQLPSLVLNLIVFVPDLRSTFSTLEFGSPLAGTKAMRCVVAPLTLTSANL